MKIALVSPYDFAYPGGVTSHISHLAREFTREGHTVRVLAPCSVDPRSIDGPEVIPCGRPVPVPTAGSVARLSLSVWHEPRIRTLLRQEAFDVVHVHEPFAPMLPLVAVHASPCLTVGTFHAFNEHAQLYRVSKYVLRRIARRLDGRIAVSRAALNYVGRHFPARYKIIPNGIDVDWFTTPSPPPPPLEDDGGSREGRINLLFVGRLEKRKGLRFLLAAYAALKWDYPELRLIVVGPGEPDPDSYRVMAERNLSDVVFAGRVSQEELRGYYQHADIFCSPATGRESFGIVLLEAMSGGAPVVATDIDGYRDVISHGENGLLARPRDEESLASVLRTMIENPQLRRRLAENARKDVESYRWDRIARRVLEYYEQTAESRRRKGLATALAS